MTIREMAAEDLDWVLALNRQFETELSPLDRPRLGQMRRAAFRALVADPEAALLLAFDQDAAYDSPNFLWFRARYPRFVYVDRIAVAPQQRRKGHAQMIYRALFDAARADGHDRVVCEVNSEPPNPHSDAFHAALGFAPVGEARLGDRAKTVRYLARPLTGG